METAHLDSAVANLLTTFNDLNCVVIDELYDEPSPLEFMRYVARNTPFVIRGGAADWKAVKVWDAQYLTRALAGQTVNVAVTPDGQIGPGGVRIIAKPLEEDQEFEKFLAYLRQQEHGDDFDKSEVRYAQTQNDNLRNEYSELYADVLKDIPFARIALLKKPDAINLWIGNSRSTTALHKDPMENIYVQVKGQKHFTLLPPLCQPCVNECPVLPATYHRLSDDSLAIQLDGDEERVPLATWDPDKPELGGTAFSHLAKPLRVTLRPGDMLYLPALWYHKVAQSCNPGDEGFVMAVNYWYDMDYRGLLYPFTEFMRDVDMKRPDQVTPHTRSR